MTPIRPEIYLRRAVLLLEDIEKEIQALSPENALRDSSLHARRLFPPSMIPGLGTSRHPNQFKSLLALNIRLANQEIANAGRINPEATIEAFGATLNGTDLRAMAACAAAKLEIAWGETEEAKHLLENTLRIAECAHAHYLLGLLYRKERKPRHALQHFERFLALEPDGKLSMPVAAEANAIRNCRKALRGRRLPIFVRLFFPLLLLDEQMFFLSRLQ